MVLGTLASCSPESGFGIEDIAQPPAEAETPPILGELSITPPRAAAGAQVEIRFVADQELSTETTAVTVDGRPATWDVTRGLELIYAYHVTGDEPEGTVHVQIDAKNLFDLEAHLSGEIELDFTPPSASDLAPTVGISTHVPGAFGVTATFEDAGVGIEATDCNVCKLTDPYPCDPQNDIGWGPAAYAGTTCTATGLTCSNNEVFQLQMRATDGVGNLTATDVITRTCDTQLPVPGPVTLSGNAQLGFVGSPFDMGGTFEDAAGVAECQYCAATDGTCDEADWQPTTFEDGACSITGLTCNTDPVRVGNDELTLNLRARDFLRDDWRTAVGIVRTCDTDPPTPGDVTDSGRSGFVSPGFFIQAPFADGPGSIATCEVCVATDGACDDEWLTAERENDLETCTADGLPCTDGDSLTVVLRATDGGGNQSETAPFTLTCDGNGPSAGDLTIAAGGSDTHVAGTRFVLEAAFSDAAGPVMSCESCTSIDGVCNTEWQPALFDAQNGVCISTDLHCAGTTTVTMALRATDAVGNVTQTSPLLRACDEAAPTVSDTTLAGVFNATHIASPFGVSGDVADVGVGLTGCEVCVSRDGQCDGEWVPAIFDAAAGRCALTGITCSDGEDLDIVLRAADDAGNLGAAPPFARVCDVTGPTAGDVMPADSDDGTYVTSTFDLATSFDDRLSGVASCEVCLSTDGSCDTEWAPATYAAGSCSAPARTCATASPLTMAMRATDALGNVTTAAAISRTCDGAPPSAGAPTAIDSATASVTVTHVGGTFHVVTAFTDAGAGVASCEVCQATDGSCDGEWTPATVDPSSGTCESAQTCTNGEVLTLTMRATDTVGNRATATSITRTCDTFKAQAGAVGFTAGASIGAVSGAGFDVAATFVDAGAGVVGCEVCRAVDGQCDDEWETASFDPATDTCSATGLACASGQFLIIAMRATDGVGIVSTTGNVIRSCDGTGPAAGPLSATGTVSGGYASATFTLAATFVDSISQVASCEYCAAIDGSCDAGDWSPADFFGGLCDAVVSCNDGAPMTLAMRATDEVGNAGVTLPIPTAVCDTQAPTASGFGVVGEVSAAYTAPPFVLSATVVDGGAGAASCEVCKTTDGVCNVEWQPASLVAGTCSLAGLTCLDGDDLTLGLRVTDAVGNRSSPVTVSRTCDARPPTIGGMTVDTSAPSITHVASSGFGLLTAVSDTLSPSITCEVCVSADGLCDDEATEWLGDGESSSAHPAPITVRYDPLIGECSAAGVQCTADGQRLTFGMRAVDLAGQVATASIIQRTCDGGAPSTTSIVLSSGSAGSGTDDFVKAGGFEFVAEVEDTVLGAGVQDCEYCYSPSGGCSAGDPYGSWTPGVFSPLTGECRPPAPLTCTAADTWTLSVRSRDDTDRADTIGASIPLRCDGAPPAVTATTIVTKTDTSAWGQSSHVGRRFAISASFNEAATGDSGLARCDVCVTTDGACDTASDWIPAQLTAGTCRVATASCLDGQDLTINMRAVDLLGQVGEAIAIERTCDDSAPDAGAVLLTAGATVTHVRGTAAGFNTRTIFTDALSGLSRCEFCKSEDGLCDTEWTSAGVVLQPNGSCEFAGEHCTEPGNGTRLDVVIQMRATDAVGNVGTSTPISRTCDSTPPSVPVLVVDNPMHEELLLEWQESVDLGSGVQNYFVEYDTANVASLRGTSVNPGQDSPWPVPFAGAVLDGLSQCTTHWIEIRVVDRVGNESLSNRVSRATRCGSLGTFTRTVAVNASGTQLARSSGGGSIAVGDFNADGIPDVVTAGTNIEVHIGNRDPVTGWADGTFDIDFSLASPGTAIEDMVTADFDGDGILDLVTSHFTDNMMRLFLGGGSGGRGDGTFTHSPAADMTGVRQAQKLETGDMNDDGVADLVVYNRTDQRLEVWLANTASGRGVGTFTRSGTVACLRENNRFDLADFDGDDILDVVATCGGGSVSIFLGGGTGGRGTGTLGAASLTLGSLGEARDVDAADLDNDDVLDLAIASDDGQVRVFLGNGADAVADLTFTQSFIQNLNSPRMNYVEALDVNADDVPDLVLNPHEEGGATPLGELTILLGNGAAASGEGVFGPPVIYAVGSWGRLGKADFDGDGLLDLAFADNTTQLKILFADGQLGRGDGTFGGERTTSGALACDPWGSAVGDFDDDGIADVVTGGGVEDGATCIAFGTGTNGQGDAVFTGGTITYPGGRSRGTLVADLDEDGIQDVVVASQTHNGIKVLMGQGSDGRGNRVHLHTFSLVSAACFNLASGDFNSDGITDVVTGEPNNDRIAIYLGLGSDGRGDGTFAAAVTYAAGDSSDSVVTGDFNSDGVSDVAVGRVGDPALGGESIAIFLGGVANLPAGGYGNGTFALASTVSLRTGAKPASLRTGDFNADGITDLVAATGTDRSVVIIRGNGTDGVGNGSFATPSNPAGYITTTANVTRVRVADLNHDAIQDLVILEDTYVRPFLGQGSNGRGDGTFAQVSTGANYWGQNGASELEVGDFNDDGVLDAMTLFDNGGIRVRYGTSCGDGAQNGTELGIDCGGACPPCP